MLRREQENQEGSILEKKNLAAAIDSFVFTTIHYVFGCSFFFVLLGGVGREKILESGP